MMGGRSRIVTTLGAFGLLAVAGCSTPSGEGGSTVANMILFAGQTVPPPAVTPAVLFRALKKRAERATSLAKAISRHPLTELIVDAYHHHDNIREIVLARPGLWKLSQPRFDS